MSRYQGNWGGGGGGGNRGGHKQQDKRTTDWRETVRTDRSVAERPIWNLTCYAHDREGANDITGDISPEEVRWANMQAAQQGMPGHQLANEFKAAEKAKVEQFQNLARLQKPPSKGGNPLPHPTHSISGLVWIDGGGFQQPQQQQQPLTSLPFGQQQQQQPTTGLFGQQQPTGSNLFGNAAPPQPPATTSGFGQTGSGFGSQPFGGGGGAAATPPQQPQQASSLFGGGASSGGFGGTFGGGASKPLFGSSQPQQPVQTGGFGSSPFGQQAAAAATSTSRFGGGVANTTQMQGGFGGSAGFGGGFGAPAAPTGSVFGAPAAAPSVFGSAPQQQQQPTSGLFGSINNSTSGAMQQPSPWGSQPATTFGNPTANTAAATPQNSVFGQIQPANNASSAPPEQGRVEVDGAVWQASTFTKGKIPECAPPAVYCA